MTGDQSEQNTTINFFVDFWENESLESTTTERPEARELLTKCLDEVTVSYMMSKRIF